jgi:hypothetical protein
MWVFLLSSASSMHLPITSSKLRWELLIPSSSKFSLLFVVGLQRFFKLPSVGVVFVFQCGFISSCWSILVLYVSTSWSWWSHGNGNPMVLWRWWSSISNFDSLLKLGQLLLCSTINKPISLFPTFFFLTLYFSLNSSFLHHIIDA